MVVILGLDAAWTTTEPSGVALVTGDTAAWRCRAVAPSYDDFFIMAAGRSSNWTRNPIKGTAPSVKRLLDAAETLAGAPVDVVAIDMPVATQAFTSRREADDAISKEFGARWCSAHTPNAARPGPMGAGLSDAFFAAGFTLATTSPPTQLAQPKLIEVYPHPALLSLLKRTRRVPYKVAKSRKYWPTYTLPQRLAALHAEFTEIHRALAVLFGSLGFDLPDPSTLRALATLKRYEDALDALVCAWVATEHLAQRTSPLGAETAAIWCPRDVIFS